MEAVRTSETSVENHFTRQYNLEDNSEQEIVTLNKEFRGFPQIFEASSGIVTSQGNNRSVKPPTMPSGFSRCYVTCKHNIDVITNHPIRKLSH
jgi:hypothetical protein